MRLKPLNLPKFILSSVIGFCFLSLGYTQNATSNKNLDSLYKYYDLSNSDSLSVEARLTHLDVFLNGVNTFNIDSLLLKGLMQKTFLLGKIQQYDSAIIYTNRLFELARKNKDTTYLKKALIKNAFYHKRKSNLSKSFYYYSELYEIAKLTGDKVYFTESLLQMSNIQQDLGDYSGCLITAFKGLESAKDINNLRQISGLYHIIAVANREQKNLEEAILYNDKTLSLVKDSIVKNKIGFRNTIIFQNTRANLLADLGRYDEAVSVFEMLLSDTELKKDRYEYPRVLSNLAYVLWLRNKENKDSERLFHDALKIQNDNKDIRGLISSNIYMTRYYFEKDKNKSLLHAEKAYYYANERNHLIEALDALSYLIKLKENPKIEAKKL